VILAVDVAYTDPGANAAGILFERWDSETIARRLVVRIDSVADYVPGQFYRRELPCIERLLAEIKEPLEAIVIDGYVELGADRMPGLGRHLWGAICGQTPIIGVAKTAFAGTPDSATILRGKSLNPLYVTAIGVPLDEAKRNILALRGDHRLPDFLKEVDGLSRRGQC
jgi:deoxyribonuclease V